MPHNWIPAKIFMGDSGAMFLGLGLAVLSIMGGAKLALALMVLGIPILDVAVVAINRMRRGQSAVRFDNSHMHYRLLATGLSVKQICLLFYGLTVMFGVLALRLSHIYKFIGLALVVLTMFCLILFVDRRLRQRGIPIHPDPEPAPNGSHDQPAGETNKRTSGSLRQDASEYSEQSLQVSPSSSQG